MTEVYSDALKEQMDKNIWDTLADEALGMSGLEYATVTADIVGIFEPTPFADITATGLSLLQGDLLGAGLSLAGVIPYGGDAVAKPLKIAKYAPRTARAVEGALTAIFKTQDEIANLGGRALKQTFGGSIERVAAAREVALTRVRQAYMDARNRVPNCQDCLKLTKADGTGAVVKMPANGDNGRWIGGVQPTNGTGTFGFTTPKTLPDGRQVSEIDFVNGSPDFSDYVQGDRHQLWDFTGNVSEDAAALRRQMAEVDPSWRPPSGRDYALHHFDDGSVGYVPHAIHTASRGGVAHTGPSSMMDTDLF